MKRSVGILLLCIIIISTLASLCSCGGGELLKTVEGDGKKFELYGAGNSIRFVVVYGGGGYADRIGKYEVKGEASKIGRAHV